MSFTGLESLSTTDIYLKDSYKHQKINLSFQSSYDFAISAEEASYGPERFRLVFSEKRVTALEPIKESRINVYPNPSNGTLAVSAPSWAGQSAFVILYDALGRQVFEKTVDLSAPIKLITGSQQACIPYVYLQECFLTLIKSS